MNPHNIQIGIPYIGLCYEELNMNGLEEKPYITSCTVITFIHIAHLNKENYVCDIIIDSLTNEQPMTLTNMNFNAISDMYNLQKHITLSDIESLIPEEELFHMKLSGNTHDIIKYWATHHMQDEDWSYVFPEL